MAVMLNMTTCSVEVSAKKKKGKILVTFPHQLVNQSTVFFMMAWQITMHNVEVELQSI